MTDDTTEPEEEVPVLHTFICYLGVERGPDGYKVVKTVRPGPVPDRSIDLPCGEANPGEFAFYFFCQDADETPEGWARRGNQQNVSGRYYIDGKPVMAYEYQQRHPNEVRYAHLDPLDRLVLARHTDDVYEPFRVGRDYLIIRHF